jgi:hypothetical protein
MIMKKHQQHFTLLIIEDYQGETKFEIQNDCTQLRIENQNGSIHINTCGNELLLLAETIERVVDKQFPKNK